MWTPETSRSFCAWDILPVLCFRIKSKSVKYLSPTMDANATAYKIFLIRFGFTIVLRSLHWLFECGPNRLLVISGTKFWHFWLAFCARWSNKIFFWQIAYVWSSLIMIQLQQVFLIEFGLCFNYVQQRFGEMNIVKVFSNNKTKCHDYLNQCTQHLSHLDHFHIYFRHQFINDLLHAVHFTLCLYLQMQYGIYQRNHFQKAQSIFFFQFVRLLLLDAD